MGDIVEVKTEPLRLGVLGAANISGKALYHPVSTNDRVDVVAIAARDRARAEAHAAQHGVAHVEDDYAAVLARDDIDAVFNPLAISLHHPWTLAALEAGKHVLCEKPFASNADQAVEMVAAADRTGLVLVEAFHWRYHPLAARIDELVDLIGGAELIEATFNAAIPESDEVRRSWELSGGALMDLGCYPVQWARFAAGREPIEVEARMCPDTAAGRELVDVETHIDLDFGDGCTGSVHTRMDAGFEAWLTVTGPRGWLRVVNPLAPHMGHSVEHDLGDGPVFETVDGLTTYQHQMEAFVAAVCDGESPPTGGQDSIDTMRIIDRAYISAGLPPRGT